MAFIQTEEGKAVPAPAGANAYYYYYTLSDHLGNSRLMFDTHTGSTATLQTDDYYPFGMEIARTTPGIKNEYLYNHKELQEELGQQDYGARFYDPVIGRMSMIDPKSELNRRWTPYNFVLNNPIRLIDPDGMEWEETYDKKGKKTHKNKDQADQVRKDITKVNAGLAKDNEGLTKDTAKAKASGNESKVAKLTAQMDDNSHRIGQNDATLKTIDAVESSSKIFRFGSSTQTSSNESGDEVQTTSFGRDANGVYVINNSGNLANKSHELTHAGQIASGLIDVIPGTIKPFGFGEGAARANLEFQAYGAGYGIDGNKHLGFGEESPEVCGLDDTKFNQIVNEDVTSHTPQKP